MGFRLPRLTTDVDCEPLGYPGLVFTFWLNPMPADQKAWRDEWIAPADRDPPVAAEDLEPWDLPWLMTVAHVFDRITVPAEYTDSGEEEIIEIPDAKAVYDVFEMPDFEPKILNWALESLRVERNERFQVAAKN